VVLPVQARVAAARDGRPGLVDGAGDLVDGALVDLALEDEQPRLGALLRGLGVVDDPGRLADGLGHLA